MAADIAKLARQITLAAKAYYEGTAMITDEQFDWMVEQLRAQAPEHPILTTPGWGYKPEGKLTAQHEIFVGSLPKVHNLESIKRGSILTPKLDGISIVAYYDKGRLQRVMTRGDGTTGVIVTGRVNVPNRIKAEWVRYIKGEACITHANFEQHLSGAGYANARNATAGIVNALDSEHTHLVEFIAYEVGNSSTQMKMDPVYYEQVTKTLVAEEFIHAPWTVVQDPEDLTLTDLKTQTDGLQWPTDGLVHDAKEAIKFPTEAKESTVRQIHWNQSDKGRLIPVLEIEPLELYGTTVTNVTAYHAQFVKDHNLGPGAKVKVTKANEIIPYITDVTAPSEDVSIPEGRWDGVHLVYDDPAVVELKRAIKFVRTLVPIDGLGDTVVETLLEKIKSKSVKLLMEHLYLVYWGQTKKPINFEDSFNGLTPHLVKLGGLMIKHLTEPVDRDLVLYSLNLDGIGQTASRDLAPHLEKLKDADDADEFREHIKQNRDKAVKSLNDHLPMIRKVLRHISLTEIQETKSVVLTGKMSQPRKTVVARLKQMGYTEVKTPTEDSIVIAADPEGGSSKLKKARKIGATIMTEEEFFAQT